MIKTGLKMLVASGLATIAGSAFAAGYNCDCSQIVGSCAASISVKPTESTKGSYGAELTITSSSPICSKVDYYIDSTPYFTVLSQGNTASDSTYGLKPIFRENVKIESCKVCKQVGGEQGTKPGKADQQQEKPADVDYSGTWSLTGTCSWGSGSSSITLTKAGEGRYRVSGSLPNHSIDSGIVEGTSITVHGSHWLGNTSTYSGTITGPTSMQGTFTQGNTAEVCNWTARK
ncbi:hypothetical protein N7414_24790 [Pseudomonas sp. GD04087]|uniref:hypothetical protein n=1 Tax=unclassified Pseudomonas TaxID=196821 RepID=UPI00244D0E73|nr:MULTISPECIES: hypothetical protein [unclassified Pseudomonas]MDH0292352.1 hypothetical protein [Pseudomonas sp. GD04087]MDH1048820.1 hypothetical protein [Pseudomonas sp. GD03903]MDH2001312.1 hypothetical protein [Pseudomonas sp. GD03691]